MNQVLQMQNQLMQGFLISENRLKKKQEELNQEVEAQIAVAQKKLVKKQRKAENKKEQWIESIQQESEKAFTSLKNYRDFAQNIRKGLDKLPKLNSNQDPNKMLASTSQKLTHLQKDVQSGKLIDFDAICDSIASLVEPTKPLQKEIKTKRQNYIQQQAQAEQELIRQNEEFILSVLLMIVSAGLVVSMIWFVG